MTDRAYLTIPETAAELRISRAGVYRLIHRNDLQAVRVGGLLRVTRLELDRFAERSIVRAS